MKIQQSYFGEFREPMPTGPAVQYSPPFPTIPTLDIAGGAAPSYTSPAILTEGFRALAISLQSTRSGNLSVQRYLDDACQIPIGAVITQALSAGQQNFVYSADDIPFSAMKFTVTNTDSTAGHTAVISNGGILLQGG